MVSLLPTDIDSTTGDFDDLTRAEKGYISNLAEEDLAVEKDRTIRELKWLRQDQNPKIGKKNGYAIKHMLYKLQYIHRIRLILDTKVQEFLLSDGKASASVTTDPNKQQYQCVTVRFE